MGNTKELLDLLQSREKGIFPQGFEKPVLKADVLNEYPEWIVNIITVIDYDTELQMEGLDFRSYDAEIKAFRSIGIDSEAEVLSSLSSESTDEDLSECYDRLALNNDYDAFWLAVFEYAEENLKKR